jgi:hypothetical protein
MRSLLLLVFVLAAVPALAYDPPIGIPEPPFGIDETTDDNTYDYWVDNSGSCSDSGNGSPGSPRCTIPTTFSAGEICQVRGGPYNLPSDPTFTGNGTSGSPVYLRGPTSPASQVVLQQASNDRVTLYGSYFIFENFNLHATATNSGGDHISVRYNDIGPHPNRNGNNTYADYVVYYDNHIHDCGNYAVPDDRHGIYAGSTTDYLWILENEIEMCSGDGIQFCHNCAEPGPQWVYIGGNNIHENIENAVDFKTSEHIVISQNEMWGHVPAGGSDGTAVLIGSNGLDDQAVDIWVIFNLIRNNTKGIRIEAAANGSGSWGPAYILGNVIRDCTSAAIQFDKGGAPIHIVNNTIENCDHFLRAAWRDNFDLVIYDNIAVDLAGSIYDDVYIEPSAVADVSDLDRTIFYQGGGSLDIAWGGSTADTYTDTADLQANFEGGSENYLEDPDFVDQANHDFNLEDTSPAIDIGSESSIYDTYFSTYGESIEVDYDGVSRPQGSGWDAGAFEYESGAPAGPGNVTIHYSCPAGMCIPVQ